MRSKSETGMSLDRINWYFGVANALFMDNAHTHTGYNTEIKLISIQGSMDCHTTDPYYGWQNKAESMIIILIGQSKRVRVQRNITMSV